MTDQKGKDMEKQKNEYEAKEALHRKEREEKKAAKKAEEKAEKKANKGDHGNESGKNE